MKITPIINNFFITKTNQTNTYKSSQTKSLRTSLPVDTVTFQASIVPEDIKRIKTLLAYQIPDMYSGKIMIDPKEVESILQSKIFSRPLSKSILVLKKYKQSLFPVEQEVVSILEKDAKRYPTIKLEDAIHMRTMQALLDLRQTQKPIFESLITEAQKLPPDKLKEFNNLMEATRHRLYNQPILIPYSAKEFKYKLTRIMDGIKSRGVYTEIKTMRKLINIASTLPEKTIKEHNFKSKKKTEIRLYPKTNINHINGKIHQMSKILEASALKRDKELNELFNSTKMKIYNIPIIAPFGRKSFLYELKKITHSLEDAKLARELEKIAAQLPTSKQNVSAFIMHAATHSSEKIGFDILCSSIGTVEHLLPSKHGGGDFINNLGLATSFLNSERGHRHMDTQMNKHPEIYENCQKYVDRLIELHNKGIFKKLGIDKSYIKNFVLKMKRMSPPDRPLNLDISKLN